MNNTIWVFIPKFIQSHQRTIFVISFIFICIKNSMFKWNFIFNFINPFKALISRINHVISICAVFISFTSSKQIMIFCMITFFDFVNFIINLINFHVIQIEFFSFKKIQFIIQFRLFQIQIFSFFKPCMLTNNLIF